MDESQAAGYTDHAMRNRYARAELLIDQSRYEDAERELRRILTDAPNDPIAHAYLALTLTEQSRFVDATDEARQAIALAPELPLGHAVLGQTMLSRQRPAEAIAAFDQGLAFAAEDIGLKHGRAVTLMRLERFDDALAEVNSTLAINGDHLPSLTLRTTLLQQLGRLEEATATNDEALRINAASSGAHSTRGWVLLEQGRPAEARERFAEALRLDPQSEHARAGLVESIKGTSWFYRQFQKYIFWSAKLSQRGGWAFLIGGYLCFRLMLWTMTKAPEWTFLIGPLVAIYIAAAIVSWLAVPISNLLLRLHKDGRLALTSTEKRSSELVGAVLAFALAVFVIGVSIGSQGLVFTAFAWTILALPTSAIFKCENGWPRWVLAAGCGLVAVALLLATFQDGRLPPTVATLVAPALIGLQFAAFPLTAVRLKK